jgi:hypothetical protein
MGFGCKGLTTFRPKTYILWPSDLKGYNSGCNSQIIWIEVMIVFYADVIVMMLKWDRWQTTAASLRG